VHQDAIDQKKHQSEDACLDQYDTVFNIDYQDYTQKNQDWQRRPEAETVEREKFQENAGQDGEEGDSDNPEGSPALAL